MNNILVFAGFNSSTSINYPFKNQISHKERKAIASLPFKDNFESDRLLKGIPGLGIEDVLTTFAQEMED